MLGKKILKMAPLSIQKFDLEDMRKLVAIVAASEMRRESLIKQNRSANEFGKFFEFRTAIILLHFV